MDEIYLFLYRSIHDVMRCEATLKRAGIPRRLVPVPTSVTSDCGMAVAVAPAVVRPALEALASAGARPLSTYHKDPSGRPREVDPGVSEPGPVPPRDASRLKR